MKPRESRLRSATSIRPSIGKRTTKSLLLNLDDFAEPLISVPPDGGWGWVIVAVSFLLMFCLDGIGYCFAVFFKDISKDLNCEITDVALTSSILGGFYYLSGPITCSAINRFGFQKIALMGGMLALISFTAASYVQNVLHFTILIGVFGGSAFNLIYTPSVIAIGFYFEKWRALAMAITCCGSSLGVMCCPLIMTQLMEKFTWRVKFRILGGIFGICGILGLTYRPVKATKIERTVQFGDVAATSTWSIEEEESEIHNEAGGLFSIFQRFKNAWFPTISELSIYSSRRSSREPSRFSSKYSGLGTLITRRETDAMSYFLNVDPDNKSVLHPVIEEDSDEEEIHRRCKKCRKCCRSCYSLLKCSACCKNKSSSASLTNINRPMYREDIFFTGSINLVSQSSRQLRPGGSQLPRTISQRGEPSIYTLSVTRAPTQKDLMEQNQCKCCPEAFLRVLATMLDFEMLTSLTFILLVISGYLSLMGTYIVFTYIVERALEMGIERQYATLLLSILGIANTFGRAACGVVSCLPTDINVISWITIGICGGSTIASVYLPTALGQIIFCCIFGFTIATFAVLRAIMFVELFGIEKLTNCFGLNMVFQSAAAFSGVPIANCLLKASGTFKVPFIFTGAAIILSAILLIPLRCILQREHKNDQKRVTFVN